MRVWAKKEKPIKNILDRFFKVRDKNSYLSKSKNAWQSKDFFLTF